MILFCSNVGTLILFCSFVALPFLPFHPPATRATILGDQFTQEHGHGSRQNPSDYFHTLITRTIPNYCRPTRTNAAANNIMKGGSRGARGAAMSAPAISAKIPPNNFNSYLSYFIAGRPAPTRQQNNIMKGGSRGARGAAMSAPAISAKTPPNYSHE